MIYANHVEKPGDITKMENIFSVITNIRDSFDYAKSSLINGYDCKGKSLVLGDSYFVQSGTCDNTSDDPCKGKNRYLYINNIPSNLFPCISKDIPIQERCKTNQNQGIIPGILQDVMEINPFEMIYSSTGNGSVVNNRCVLRTEKVGMIAGTKQNFHYETKCSPEYKPLICSLENFTNEVNVSSLSKINFSKNQFIIFIFCLLLFSFIIYMIYKVFNV